MFRIGGPSEAFFSSAGTNYIMGLLVFASGTTVKLSKLGKLLKHQGYLVLFKIVISIVFSYIFLFFFGLDGIWGISGLSFVSIMLFIYPVISVFLPLAVGILLGNLDEDMARVFGACMPALLILLGWLLGQSRNLFAAIRTGASGVLVSILVIILTMPVMDFFETKILHYEGYSGIGLSTVAGVTTAVPAIVALALPQVSEYVAPATAQILTASIITNILAPIIVQRLYGKRHH
ncbi:2-keto-3-deoxygluconate permease [Atopococcus tabaci]|uniref:2-keto-3-deoxygluconate permease n=1 Tax=Atopococcus tabaci TaxID=269774 RepID=UPI00240A40A0|nr:2-keto-3-deoxygluconate permease [Atopococcus tabaci]